MLTMVVAATWQSATADVTITPDVVYGHKLGLAMTCDVFTPTEKANGAAMLFMVGGGWYSNWAPPEQSQFMFKPLTEEMVAWFVTHLAADAVK